MNPASCFSVLVLVTVLAQAVQAAFTTLPFGDAANAPRMDALAGDKQGGWLDLGSNDLRVMTPGRQFFGGVPFEIAPDGADAKTCVVLGVPGRDDLPRSETLSFAKPVSGEYLYLLHASAFSPAPQDKKMTGFLTVTYVGGKTTETHIRCGRDVADWTLAKSYPNCARAWSEYNNNSQVSLYISRFQLQKAPVASIRFSVTGEGGAWMVVAATIGDKHALIPLRSQLALDKTFRAPSPFDAPLANAPTGAVPKNVILIIGDGMGRGALELASLYQHHKRGALLAYQLPVETLCTTFSASDDVTDSAASGTAIATGHKTRNGTLGLEAADKPALPTSPRLTSFAEGAAKHGKSVGLITTDSITGATPSAFFAHVPSRGQSEDIVAQAAAVGYDIFVGNASGRKAFSSRKDKRDLAAEMQASGYAVVTNIADFAAVAPAKRVLGFMDGMEGREDFMHDLLAATLVRLSANTNGFFVMAESAAPDHGGHSNNPELSLMGVLQVDWMLRAAVAFAEKRGDTLILVTADHETGGVSAMQNPVAPFQISLHYAATSHTGAPVALFAYGPGAELFNGVIDNTDIARNIFRLWKLQMPAPGAKVQ